MLDSHNVLSSLDHLFYKEQQSIIQHPHNLTPPPPCCVLRPASFSVLAPSVMMVILAKHFIFVSSTYSLRLLIMFIFIYNWTETCRLQASGNCNQWWTRTMEVHSFLPDILAHFFRFPKMSNNKTECLRCDHERLKIIPAFSKNKSFP